VSRKAEKGGREDFAGGDNQLYEALNLLKGMYIMSKPKTAIVETETSIQ
jgi:hypothetical protein